ncbi:chemotaxis protein CheW [Methanoregula formicica]|uniref:Chemotaxis signal transduction protein n=1 Tax=Methanoregula formicica (strain DSM 22288 / NBRC 105244 / SMSP) TaxID=593750 RepID=L0HLG6_METFS|nr:chemotaxis protein CheW [Methanoregula formicica]AGB03904.1 chemotaxis signal transduction protein [Methanoregula formicica SMSP]
MVTKTGPQAQDASASAVPAGVSRRSGSIQVVVFALGNEQFAVDLFDVKEVVEYTTITKLPNVPPYVRGIIDLRGEITTIIDLKHRLNIAESGRDTLDTSRIIVLDNNITRSKTGILVDDVTSVSTFEEAQVDYTSASVSNEDTAIIGIIKRKVKIQEKERNELIIWIDIRKLLGDIDPVA